MPRKQKNSLVANINKRKQAGKSRSKKRSTVSKESYDEMQEGWPRSKKKKSSTSTKKRAPSKTRSRSKK